MADSKDYRRPNQEWECGWRRRGFKCPAGPTSEGRCQGLGVCQPALQDGHYICTRSGGPCSEGPRPNGSCAQPYPPCSPKRSLKSKRRLVTIGIVTFVLAILLVQIGRLKTNEVFYSPGDLSFQHSSFLNECSACHSNAHKGEAPIKWVFGQEFRQQDSSKCLDCHSMGEHAFSAHSLPKEHLEKISFKIAGVANTNFKENMQCSKCHKEHQGSRFDLTALSNQQCQTCHSESFNSFADGHPEFTDFPFGKRVHILFDHTSHFSKHFEKKDKEKTISCQTCHTTSSSGNQMVLQGYEKTCSKCHDDQIRGETALEKGVVFFRLPGLDLESLKENGVHIGQWPEYAEGRVTSFTKLLMSKDEEMAEVFSSLESDEVELDDLSDADEETLRRVGKMVWGLKKFMLDLIENGSEGISESLTEGLGDELSGESKANLISSLPIEVVRSATHRWFKNLSKEVEQNENGQRVLTRVFSVPEEDAADEDLMSNGGWYRDNGSFSIRYRPTGHGDLFLKSWLNASAQKSGSSAVIGQLFEGLSGRSDTPGMCAKCHGIEKVDMNAKVHWLGRVEQQGRQNFTRFSHKSHLNLIKEQGCFTCHDINKEADFAKIYDNQDPSFFESNFTSISKAKCTQCHQEEGVNDSCLTCHNYHIGDFFTSKERMKKVHTNMRGESQGQSTEEEEAE